MTQVCLTRLWLIIMTLTALSSDPACAQAKPVKPGTFGAGIAIGGISGVSGYYHRDRITFLQGVVSFSNFGGYFGLSGDYGIAAPNALDGLPAIRPYYGGGFIVEKRPRVFILGRSVIQDTMHVGFRIPLGIQFFVTDTPLLFGFEFTPGIFVIPGTEVFIDTQFSVRFLF